MERPIRECPQQLVPGAGRALSLTPLTDLSDNFFFPVQTASRQLGCGSGSAACTKLVKSRENATDHAAAALPHEGESVFCVGSYPSKERPRIIA